MLAAVAAVMLNKPRSSGSLLKSKGSGDDHLGSIRDIADLNEGTGVTTVTNHRTMTATGKIVSETNAAVDLLFAFTGKQVDEATGLQHNLFRWYDPALGQWVNEDPLGFNKTGEKKDRQCT